MTTAVDPGFDSLELPFDDYLCKPVRKDTQTETVAQQCLASEHDQTVRLLFRKLSKLALLEAEYSTRRLEQSPEYLRLKRETAASRTKAAAVISEFNSLESAFNSIDRSTAWDRQRAEL